MARCGRRYADTIGYHSDVPRNVWPYRDWVIQSFNQNKRFDRFTIEQIAGDLLPDANQETRVGSAFNRLLLSTEEGSTAQGLRTAHVDRSRPRYRRCLAGADDGVLTVPRPQVRPDHHAGLLLAGSILRRHQGVECRRRENGMLVATSEQEGRLAQLDAVLSERKKTFSLTEKEVNEAQQHWLAALIANPVALPELAADSKADDELKKVTQLVTDLLKKPEAEWDSQAEGSCAVLLPPGCKHKPRRPAAGSDSGRESNETLTTTLCPSASSSVSDPQKRTVRILPRGNWMDETGEVVKPALPGVPGSAKARWSRTDPARSRPMAGLAR